MSITTADIDRYTIRLKAALGDASRLRGEADEREERLRHEEANIEALRQRADSIAKSVVSRIEPNALNSAIIAYVKASPEPVSAGMIRRQFELDCNPVSLSQRLTRLVEKGLLQRSGAKRGTRYV